MSDGYHRASSPNGRSGLIDQLPRKHLMGEKLMFSADLLANERILITGGGSGLGFAIARSCSALGATVYLCGRRELVVREAAEDIVAAGGKAVGIACDIKSAESVEAMLDRIWAEDRKSTRLNSSH